MEKKLVKKLKIKGFDGQVSILHVNEKYYSVEYAGKEEYYTKDLELAESVSNVILFYFRSLQVGLSYFQKDGTDEDKWKEFIAFLNSQSKGNDSVRDVCMGVYKSLESYYYDTKDRSQDKSNGIKATIRNKDNLTVAIHRIAAMKDPTEALKNFCRYQKSRNQFVQDKQIELDLL